MGVIDKYTVELTCPDCGANEQIYACERGSMWSGGHWGDYSESKLFNVKTKMEQHGPEVTAASCKECGTAAEVKDL